MLRAIFYFCFQIFYEIYREFLVYLIARLNLAINEQSEKFWYGINDKASMSQYRKHWGRMGEYRELGKVMGGGFIGEFLVV